MSTRKALFIKRKRNSAYYRKQAYLQHVQQELQKQTANKRLSLWQKIFQKIFPNIRGM